MAVLVLLEAKAKPEAVDGLKELFRKRLDETRTYDGCQGITAHTNTEDGRTFVLVEHWESKEHYERYLAWRTETGVLAQLTALLDGAPSIRYFDPLDV